ncbi:MAG: type II toxin-antitoxin system VapC family toxin [Oscillospiraceae bacterium]|jgi:predicted nucleic acid-binding protein|nr:type II toxin-antitoxin system VapC family toxin [Oscillospiraceae bacterium]
MKKLKLYLDTSVISHLFAEDVPDRMTDTNKLWEDLINEKYDVYISPVVTDEMERCSEPKRSKMLEKMGQIKFQIFSKTDEVIRLAREYVKGGVLTEKSFDDCLHIAFAVIYNCDVIVSWNFNHLVNFKTINKVKIVNAINLYKEISIIPPTMLLEGSDE